MSQTSTSRVFLALAIFSLGGNLLVFATHPDWWDQGLGAMNRVLAILMYLTWFKNPDFEQKVPYHVYILNVLLLVTSAISVYWTGRHPHPGSSIIFPMMDFFLATCILVLLRVADMMDDVRTEALRKGNWRP